MTADETAAARSSGTAAGKTSYTRQFTPDLARPSAFSTSPIDRVLPLLDGVKQTGPNRWIARCPAHADKRPSLNIRETDDGTVLVRCFAGCGAEAIVQAVGLELCDLFPEKPNADHRRRSERAWRAIDLLRTCANEALLVAIAARDIAKGAPVDADRVADAAGRLLGALELAEVRS